MNRSQLLTGISRDNEGPEKNTGALSTLRGKSTYLNVLRLFVGLFLLWLLIRWVGVSRVVNALSSIDPYWLFLAFVVQFVAKFVWAARWSVLLTAFEMPVEWPQLVKAIFVGLFFTNFLPTSYGGDFYRAYWVLDGNGSYKKSISIVVLERLFGFATIGFIALPAFAFFLVNDVSASPMNVLLLLLLLAMCSSGLLLHSSIASAVERQTRRFDDGHFGRFMAKISNSLSTLAKADVPTWRVIGLSLLVHLAGILFLYCLGQGMGLAFEGWHYLVIVPFAMIATLLPLSFNGLGIREGVIVLFASILAVDVSVSQAVALGIMSSIVVMLVSLFGAVFYVMGRRSNARSAESRQHGSADA